jgi:hypothetical protein
MLHATYTYEQISKGEQTMGTLFPVKSSEVERVWNQLKELSQTTG